MSTQKGSIVISVTIVEPFNGASSRGKRGNADTDTQQEVFDIVFWGVL
jgi:hypothetical protein